MRYLLSILFCFCWLATATGAAESSAMDSSAGSQLMTEDSPNSADALDEPEVTGDEEEIEEVEEVTEESGSLSWDSPGQPRIERVINLPTAATTRKGTLLVSIDHRTNKTFTEDTLEDFLGFDAGQIKIGIGLRYGILRNLEAGVLRLNGTIGRIDTDTYDFDLKYQPLRQAAHHLDLALRGGVTWFAIDDLDDETGFFGQLLINRSFFDRLRLGTGLLYHSDSYNEGKLMGVDDDHSLALPFTVEARLSRMLAWNAEAVSNASGYGEDRPVLSTSLKIITHKHTFAIVVSNTQHIGPAGIATNTDRESDDWILGFTITRELPLFKNKHSS